MLRTRNAYGRDSSCSRARRGPGWSALVLGLAGCSDFGDDGRDSNVQAKTFALVDVLTSAQVDGIVSAAALSDDVSDVAIAVVDRLGNPLRLYLRGASASAGVPNPAYASLTGAERTRIDFSLAVARAAAFLSHSQAPLTSRTGQFLNAFHFPAVFDAARYFTSPPLAFPGQTLPVQATIGVANTAQAPLWQIEASNRGVPFASAATAPMTVYNGLNAVPPATRPDGTAPSPGLGLLPGGVPLYDAAEAGADVARRLIGAIGVYAEESGEPLPDRAEFMALRGAGASAFVPGAGEGVFLAGILLPSYEPDGSDATGGTFTAADEVTAPLVLAAGAIDPGEQYLIGPVSSTGVGLTLAEVDLLVQSCLAASRETHAAIRLPASSASKMIVSVCDRDGVLLGVYREEDATLFSLEISITKARNAVFFSNPASRWTDDVLESGVLAGRHPLTGFRPRRDASGDPLPLLDDLGNLLSANGDVVDVFPRSDLESTGVAITARTLGFLSQPFYPPGIDGADQAGPLYFLALKNRFPSSFDGQGFAARFGSGGLGAPLFDDTQSGIIFFPGSAALYRGGVLSGGIGVSGDGVEQDDLVTAEGLDRAADQGLDLRAPASMRADRYSFDGAPIPYFKFPQHPDG